MSEREHPHDGEATSSKISFWLLMILTLPVLYALSVGPAAALLVRFEFLETPLVAIYYPLEVVVIALDNTTWGEPLVRYIQKYVEWWGG